MKINLNSRVSFQVTRTGLAAFTTAFGETHDHSVGDKLQMSMSDFMQTCLAAAPHDPAEVTVGGLVDVLTPGSPDLIQLGFTLSGLESKKRVFLGIDSHSGGYPYWSSNFQGCAIRDKLPDPERELIPPMWKNTPTVQALEIFGMVHTEFTAESSKSFSTMLRREQLHEQMRALQAELDKLE